MSNAQHLTYVTQRLWYYNKVRKGYHLYKDKCYLFFYQRQILSRFSFKKKKKII